MRFASILVSLILAIESPLASAPVPADTKKAMPVALIPKLIGKSHFSKEASAAREAMKDPPIAIYSTYLDSSFYHDWKSSGLCMRFDQDCNIERVLLYSGLTKGYLPYLGEIPHGLAFTDTMSKVEKKIGKPQEVSTGIQDRVRCSWSYPSKGLVIEFDTYDIDDTKAPISYVGVFKPEDKDKK